MVDSTSLAAAETLATDAVRRKAIKGYLVLGHDVLGGAAARYAGVNATAVTDMQTVESIVRRELLALELRESGVAADRADQITRMRFTLHAERLTRSGRGGSGRVNLLFAISVAVLLYVTIVMYGQNVLRGVIEEKQTRVAEIVISSVRPTTLLAGKVLGVGAVGMTQIMIWGTAAYLMLRYRVAVLHQFGMETAPVELPSISLAMLAVLVLFFLFGYIFYSALFATIGAMVSTEQEAQQAQMPIVLLLAVSMMFLQPVLNEPDGRLASVLGVLPVSSPVVMPLRISAVDVPPWEIVLSLIALVAACYLAVYFAARVYRTGLLMYGKRVSIREVLRWMRPTR